jgi:hypothetical protein
MKANFKKLSADVLSSIIGGSGGCTETVNHGDGSSTVYHYDAQGNLIYVENIFC